MKIAGIISTLMGIVISASAIQQDELIFLIGSIPLVIMGLCILLGQGDGGEK